MKRVLVVVLALLASTSSAASGRSPKFRMQLGKVQTSASTAADYDFTILGAGLASYVECSGAAIPSDTPVTFTRASIAYCTKADGSMVQLASNVPVINAHGLLVEQAKNNPLLRSQEFDNAAWTKVNVTVTANTHAAPDGTTTAETLATTSAGGYIQSTAITSATTLLVTALYLRSLTGTQDAAIQIYDTVAGVARCTGTRTATMTWSMTYGPIDTRLFCFTQAAVSGNSFVIRIYPGGLSGSGSIVAWGANVGTSILGPMTYVPTTNVTFTRQIDVAAFTPPVTFTSAGCFAATITHGLYTPSFGRYVGSDTTAALGYTTSSTTAGMSDGVNGLTVTTGALTNRTFAVRTSWAGAGKSLTVDAATGSNLFDGTMSGTGAVWWIGSQSGSGSPLGGYLRNIRIGRTSTGCKR